MENPDVPRLKFKCFYIGGYKEEACLVPNDYRLATIEEFETNIDIFRQWGLPIKMTGNSFQQRPGNARLLDGYIEINDNFHPKVGTIYCEWIVAVKKKERDGVKQWRWRNCSDFNSSDGNLLRKQLYTRVSLPGRDGIQAAWLHALEVRDVELLYWLLVYHANSLGSSSFNPNLEPIGIPLRKIVERLGSDEPRFLLHMEDAREEASEVLEYAIKEGTQDWGVAMVELFIEVYGPVFVEEAAALPLSNAKGVPIFTKLSSVCLDLHQEQISNNIRHFFAEVFIEAAERGYNKLVDKMLVEFKDDIAQISRDNCVRALRAAVRGGCIELVRSLLDLLKSRDGVGLPIEVDDKGNTFFHYALFHKEVFQQLKETYASSYHNIITRQDKSGRNFLHWAAKGACDSQVVRDILKGSISSTERLNVCDQRDEQGRTPLHIAASKGYSGMIEILLADFEEEGRTKYIQESDSSGQTALHMAAGEGHLDSVNMLLQKGSQPLRERDSHRKTALHHAALVKRPQLALATCKELVESREISPRQKSLLLWASATGIGTADEMEGVHPVVKRYLQSKKKEDKEHLLRAAAVTNNAEMAWELLNRGANMADILDSKWRKKLLSSEKSSVANVISHMERMKEQGRDQPSMEDKLGRHIFAEGLAALLLNRFTESPITVGISGEWGMGKSSLMFQTEKILLITAAQLTFPNLLPSEEFVGAQKISLSTRGKKIYRRIKRGFHNLQAKSENPLVSVLNDYQTQYHGVYRSLACMDNIQMLQPKSVSQQQEHAVREVPRILTIRYNAWHYRDRHEAWAGLGVTITREIEKAMTRAQWMSTCWRYTWAKHRVNIWIQIFLPCLLSISLAGWVAWIAWMLLKQAKFKGLKYGSIPFTVIAITWVVLQSVISVVKPVSTQMLGYITKPDHSRHLGYQEDVIDDINFLKKELGKQPHWFFSFILGVWCWNWFGLYPDNIEDTRIPKFLPASGDRLRIVTFVDDLDRCEEEVILQVLSAVNLILAECKINVILGIDKKMIARAIRRKFEGVDDEDIAEKFICKVIQIPLSLPDPTGEETRSFLKCHLGQEIPTKLMKKELVFRSRGGSVVEPTRNKEEEETSSNTVLEVDYTPQERESRESRGIIKSAVHWLGCSLVFAFTVACNLSTELRQLYEEESSNSLGSAEGVRLIRELLMPNYTKEEADLFYELSEFASGNQKLPREWKRLMNYHKFAWYVIFRTGNIYNLPTWKEELIGWIFVCWQWKREMNHLIKNWDKYTPDLFSGHQGPPLSEIVAKVHIDPLKTSESSVSDGSNTSKREEDFMRLIGSSKQDPSMRAILCLYKDNERINEGGTSEHNWRNLKKALEIRDVSMEAIQLFQQFRFYCETDYLETSLKLD